MRRGAIRRRTAGLALHCAGAAVCRRVRADPVLPAGRHVDDRPSRCSEAASSSGSATTSGSGTIRASGARSCSRSNIPLVLTPILMILGFALALLTADNTPLKRLTRTVIFLPVVIGLVELEPALVLAVRRAGRPLQQAARRPARHRPADGLVRRAPISRFWAVVISITWKVVGFGMVLFIAAHPVDRPGDPGGGDHRRRRLLGARPSASSCR